MRWQTEVTVSGSLSITKPGLTPVPRSVTFLRARDLLQLFADLVIEREGELLARRDDVAAALEEILELAGDVAQARAGGVADDVRTVRSARA